MKSDNNTILSHVYGLSGLIPGVVGLVFAVKSDAPWAQYALVISGWLVAGLYGLMLVKCFNQVRSDGEIIGQLREELRDVKGELAGRNLTLDYLASSKLGRPAVARASSTPPQATTPPSQGAK